MVCTGYTFMVCPENSLCRRLDMYFTNLRTACWNFCNNYITQGWALLDLGIFIIKFNVLHDLCFSLRSPLNKNMKNPCFKIPAVYVFVCVCMNLQYNMLHVFKYLVTLKVTDFWLQIFLHYSFFILCVHSIFTLFFLNIMLHVCKYLVTLWVAMISNQIFNKVKFFFLLMCTCP